MDEIEQAPEIRVSRQPVEEGYCNACTNYPPKYRTTTHFNLRGWCGRVCDPCKEELIRQLKRV